MVLSADIERLSNLFLIRSSQYLTDIRSFLYLVLQLNLDVDTLSRPTENGAHLNARKLQHLEYMDVSQ